MTHSPFIIACDIDGTLADCNHRRPHLLETPKNWKEFDAKIGEDTPVLPLVRLLAQIGLLNHYIEHSALTYGCSPNLSKILLVSARKEEQRQVTESWLLHHGVPYDQLYMRPSGDFRDDQFIKKEILDAIIVEHGKKPDIVFEDRDRLVKMWRENGILCCQVAEGNF
jgi:hypothetical protein